ncbi:MAG: C40 family peptidase [Muribaculaceae bacterium]|nr:C40 family peptidase [Muribaculaceae bacterium]
MGKGYGYTLPVLAAVLLAIVFTGCGSSKTVAGAGYAVDAAQPENEAGGGSYSADDLVKEAKKWLGTKYSYGGSSRKGTDCSGMVMMVFKDVCGIKLPRSSASQQQYCKSIKRKELKAGDLVFFATGKNKKRVSHVGLYIGNDEIIHSTTRKGVIISNLDEKYYLRTFHSCGRVPALF